MTKWIFIIIVGVGAYMHFTSKTNEAHLPPEENKTLTDIPATQVPDVRPTQYPQSNETTEEQCRTMGGRIINGMGCVLGVPENGNANPSISASEMEAICKSDNLRYEPAFNACISNYNP